MNTTSVPLSKRMFRVLLRFLPADFRSDYGREMEHAFDDQEREARDRSGAVGVVRVWWETLTGIFTTAPREHWEMLQQDTGYALRTMRKNIGIHVSCRTYACAGNRSEHSDIQRGAWSVAKAASISAGTTACVHSPAGTKGRHRRHGILGARNRRLSPAEPVAGRVGGIPCDVVHSLRARGSGSGANSGCVGELLRPFRSESFDGAHLFAGRRQARRAAGSGFELRILEKQVRCRSGHCRKDLRDERQSSYGGRSVATGSAIPGGERCVHAHIGLSVSLFENR